LEAESFILSNLNPNNSAIISPTVTDYLVG